MLEMMWKSFNGNVNWCSHKENNMAFPQTTENRTPLLAIYPKENKSLPGIDR